MVSVVNRKACGRSSRNLRWVTLTDADALRSSACPISDSMRIAEHVKEDFAFKGCFLVLRSSHLLDAGLS